MKDDEWCEFCNDKLKAVKIIIKGREHDICKHCESLTTTDIVNSVLQGSK